MIAKRKNGKSASNKSWSVRFAAQSADGAVLPSLYLGYAKDMQDFRYPSAPSFSKTRMAIYERLTGKHYAHYIGSEAATGIVKEIRLSNTDQKESVLMYTLRKSGGFPTDITTICFDPATGTADSSGVITLPPHSSVSRWVIMGNASFQERFFSGLASHRYSLQRFFPNPARSFVTIRYTVPFGSQEHLRVSVFNVLGKLVWRKCIHTLLSAGTHHVIWDGRDHSGIPAGSGLYIIRLEVIDPVGKTVKMFNQSLTLLR